VDVKMKKVILVRYGEIGLKGKNRHFFESALMNNIHRATQIPLNQIVLRFGRIYLYRENTDCFEALKKVFGLVGFSVAYKLTLTESLDELKKTAVQLVAELKNAKHRGFKVQTRRPNKRFQHDSMEINRELGGAILENFADLKVDLHHPDLTIFVEIRDEGIFIYSDNELEKGPGGLPVGVSGSGLLLLSGGIDSPVAGWMMMKRGMPLDAIHFHSFPYTGEKSKEKAVDLARLLAQWRLHPFTLYIPYFTNIQVTINKTCPEDMWTILHRRFMMRIAQRIAEKYNCKGKAYEAIITGESLGQVASQTISNIAVINKALELPVIRPLIGFDKEEIIQRAEAIESFRISKQPFEDCCTVFAPKRPKTKSREADVLRVEMKLDIEALIAEALEKIEILNIS
jgi:thiamine biosynthesis protein ThiI